MDFQLSKEQQEIKERASIFVEKECRPLEADWPLSDYDAPLETTKNLIRKFREYGFRGMAIPKEVGGQGLGTVAKCIVYQEIVKSKVMHGLVSTYSGYLDPHPVLYTAPEWQKEKYLYPILKEDKFYHIHISEPDAGSDAARIKTTAVKDGDNYILNGLKRWSPPPNHFAITPLYVLAYAVTDPKKGYEGVSTFLVDYPSPGLDAVEWHETMAPGAYLGRVCDYKYENVVVPAKNMLGEEGMGFRYMMNQLNRNRCVIGASQIARAQYAQDMAIERAKKRITFGKPIADRQAIQWMLAESAMELEMANLLVYKAAWKLDNGQDARLEAAMVKATCPQVSCRVIDRAIQIHGGTGVLKETRLGEMYFVSRMGQVAEGTTEIMKMTVAKELLKKK